MSIGVITDDEKALIPLRQLFSKIKSDLINTNIEPAHAAIHPKTGTPERIVMAASKTLRVLLTKHERIVLILDKEDIDECPGVIAGNLKQAFEKAGYNNVDVVIKVNSFENWLCADLNAFINMPKRFKLTQSFNNNISPNKADNPTNIIVLLNQICLGKEKYNKTKDAINISKNASPLEIAKNSRSFRKFLNVLGHPKYKKQSKKPAKD